MKCIKYTIIFILIFLSLYFMKFHECLSDKSDDWGNFGSYIGGIGSLILSMSVFHYTYKVEQRNNKIQLLKQIETLLSKIEQYDNILFRISNATISERGSKSNENDNKAIALLDIEIRTSFAILVSLAKSCGMKDIPKDSIVKVSDAKSYANKWLEHYEKSNG